MLGLLLSIVVGVLVILVLHKLFFARAGNIKTTVPFWLLPYRFSVQKKSISSVAKELAEYGPICYVWFGPNKRVVVNDVDLARTVFSHHESYPKHLLFSPDSAIGK